MKIAIVGSGGAGMTAAWLLDGSHDVTLFERNAVLGGHARTITVQKDGRTHWADEGFGWFSDPMYPRFMRLLELTAIPLRSVPVAASFTDRCKGRTLVMPPVGIFRLFAQLLSPSHLVDLIRLDRALRLAEPMVRERDKFVSWSEFAKRLPAAFARDVVTPLMAGPWGGSCERVQEFSAYTLMKYYVLHRPNPLSKYRWRVIRDGAASYIATIASALKTCTIHRNTAVVAFVPHENGWEVQDVHGARHHFDRVIMTTGAKDARQILKDVPTLDPVRSVLDRFEYYAARVATHSDPSYMPPRRADWQNANVSTDGRHSEMTFWIDPDGGSEVFVSYLGQEEPKNCHDIATFHLPLISPNHFRAQESLETMQGQRGLFFAGDWTRDIGCHEDAVESAIEVCRRIDASLPRLAEIAKPCGLPPP